MANELELKYGCNPNQKPARIFMKEGELPIEVLNGRPGYINLLDAFNSWQLVKELKEGTLDGRKWYYYESPAFAIDSAQVDIFDATFEEKLEKNTQPSQEEFYIMCHARLG